MMGPSKKAAVEGGTAFLWPEYCPAAERGSPPGKDPSLLASVSLARAASGWLGREYSAPYFDSGVAAKFY